MMTDLIMDEIKVLLTENRWISGYLLDVGYEQLLIDHLKSHGELPADFIQSLRDYLFIDEPATKDRVAFLRWSEKESPHLINRDLAAIALLREGDITLERKDKVTGLMMYAEENSPLALEAALSFSHWRMWNEPLSKWWNWNSFLDVLDRGLQHAELGGWSAIAYLWAFTRQSTGSSEDALAYHSLLEALAEPLNKIPSRHREDFLRMKEIALARSRPAELPIKASSEVEVKPEPQAAVAEAAGPRFPIKDKKPPMLLLTSSARQSLLLLSGKAEAPEPEDPGPEFPI